METEIRTSPELNPQVAVRDVRDAWFPEARS